MHYLLLLLLLCNIANYRQHTRVTVTSADCQYWIHSHNLWWLSDTYADDEEYDYWPTSRIVCNDVSTLPRHSMNLGQVINYRLEYTAHRSGSDCEQRHLGRPIAVLQRARGRPIWVWWFTDRPTPTSTIDVIWRITKKIQQNRHLFCSAAPLIGRVATETTNHAFNTQPDWWQVGYSGHSATSFA